MAHTTMKSAINRLIKGLDKSAIISDGSNDWFPKALVKDQIDNTCLVNLEVHAGREVLPVNDEGETVTDCPVLKVLTPSSISGPEVEAWVMEYVPEALPAVRLVLDSPEIGVHFVEGGEYLIWPDGIIPRNISEALLGITEILDYWDIGGTGYYGQVADNLRTHLPLMTLPYGIGTYCLSSLEDLPRGWTHDALADALSDVLRLAAIHVKIVSPLKHPVGFVTHDAEALQPYIDPLIREVAKNPRSPEIPLLVRKLQDEIIDQNDFL